MAGLAAASGWWSAWGGVLAAAGFAWLMLNGFVADNDGVLRWHGRSDAVRLVVLFECGLAVSVLRTAQLHRRDHDTDIRLVRSWTSCRGQLSSPRESSMRDVIFIVLTIVVFAVFALIARGAEKL